MAKRKQEHPLVLIVIFFALLIQFAIIIIYKTLNFFYDVISFYGYEYKEKSGNGFFKTYFDKGNYGEFVLYRKMCKVFKKECVLTNIYLENIKTDNTEVDVLAISNKGIYVFEMKNLAGYIYGSQKDQNWTQVFNKWSKYKFYNPLRQNYAHTKAVEKYLNVDKDTIIPIVVFSNRSKLSKINVEHDINIFQFRDAVKFVKRHEKKANHIISDDDKQLYLTALLSRCNMPENIKLKHIEQVVKIKEDALKAIKKPIS